MTVTFSQALLLLRPLLCSMSAEFFPEGSVAVLRGLERNSSCNDRRVKVLKIVGSFAMASFVDGQDAQTKVRIRISNLQHPVTQLKDLPPEVLAVILDDVLQSFPCDTPFLVCKLWHKICFSKETWKGIRRWRYIQRPITHFNVHPAADMRACISPDSSMIMVPGSSEQASDVTICDANGDVCHILNGEKVVRHIACGPNFFAVLYRHEIEVFRLADMERVWTIEGQFNTMCIHDDLLYTGSGREFEIWSMSNKERYIPTTIKYFHSEFQVFRIVATEYGAVTASFTKLRVSLFPCVRWDYEADCSGALDACGSRFVFASDNGLKLHVGSMITGDIQATIEHSFEQACVEGRFEGVSMNADMILTNIDGRIKFWTHELKCVRTLKLHNGMVSVRSAPSGDCMAVVRYLTTRSAEVNVFRAPDVSDEFLFAVDLSD